MAAASSEELVWFLNLVHEKSQMIVHPEMMTHICGYGGFPRDLLRGTPPTDYDVRVPSKAVADVVVRELLRTGKVSELKTSSIMDHPVISPTEYSYTKMVVKTPSSKTMRIDLCYSQATSLGCDSLNFCEFTANNLTFHVDGSISTRIKPWQIGLSESYSEAQWLAKCIRDAIEGKLVWMIPDRFSKSMGANEASRAAFMEKMRFRLMKMQSKGFVLAEKEKRHLTSFRLAE
jgi:hypothetical protein